MAKFIEITQQVEFEMWSSLHKERGERSVSYDVDYETLYLNVDCIQSISPNGDQCVIRLTNGESITANHSAIWVLAQINEQ